jgi:hypothetical protein
MLLSGTIVIRAAADDVQGRDARARSSERSEQNADEKASATHATTVA